ncbi:ISAs1 family transposase [Azospirillum himalayense]|uniref:ISAs1 family transposase n=1 Tax=Azospirillum himalayense TaxID=654847 RepID=A0ABW0GD59_9PROT
MSKSTFTHAAASGNALLVRVKGNQPSLHEALSTLCRSQPPIDVLETTDRRRHGRQEHRRVEVFAAGDALVAEWKPHVACVVRVSRLTYLKDTRSGLWPTREEIGLYACQILLDAPTTARSIRSHWGIENRAHHVRDVTMGEDASRIRQQPGIIARFRSFALNILRANGVKNVRQTLYANALSLERLLALGTS